MELTQKLQAEMARRRAERLARLQQAVDRIESIATAVCCHFGETGGPAPTREEIHSLRAAATSWARRVALINGLTVDGEPVGVEASDLDDEDGDTARYVLDPF